MKHTDPEINSPANKTSTLHTEDLFSSDLTAELAKLPSLSFLWSSINAKHTMSRVHPKNGTLRDFVRELNRYRTKAEKKLHGVLLAQFREEYYDPENPKKGERKYSRRQLELTETASGIGFDYDDNCEQSLLDWANGKILPGSLAILHSSPRDGVNGILKYHVFCPYSHPVSGKDHQLITWYLYQRLPKLDPSCRDTSRIFWTMRSPKDGIREPWLHIREGQPIDVDAILKVAREEWDHLERQKEERCKQRLEEAEESYARHHERYKASFEDYHPHGLNEEACRHYCQSALASAVSRILNAQEGHRHNTILKECASIGNLIPSGFLHQGEAERQLIAAALAVYTDPRRLPDAERAALEALQCGMKTPRDLRHIGKRPRRKGPPRRKPKTPKTARSRQKSSQKRMRGGGTGHERKKPRRKATRKYATPPKVRPETRLLCLRWSLGAGKTHLLRQLAEQHERVLGYSPRILLSRHLADRMGLLNYQDIKGPITTDKVIVTINSAGRILLKPYEDDPSKGLRGYDLLFIDEPEQALPVIYGNKMLRLNDSGQLYLDLRTQMRSAGLVILADAFLANDTIRTVQRMMGLFDEQVQISEHHYIDKKDFYVLYKEREQVLDKIRWMLKEGKRLAIPFTKREDVATVEALLKKEFPDKSFLSIHAKAEDEARLTLHNPNEEWAKYDAVLYSPTVSSGVSFDVPDYFDHVVMVAGSVPGIRWTDLMQMFHRVRNPKSRRFYAWIDPKVYESLCTDRDEIRSEFMIGTYLTKRLLVQTDHKTGLRHPCNQEHFEAWLDLEVVERRRYKNVRRSFINYLKHHDIGYLEPLSLEERSEERDASGELTEQARKAKRKRKIARAVFNNQKRENKEKRWERTLNRPDISAREAEHIGHKHNATLAERESAQKARLKDFFGDVDKEILKEVEGNGLTRKVSLLVELSLLRKGHLKYFAGQDDKDYKTGFDLHLKHRAQKLLLLDQLVRLVEEEHPELAVLLKQIGEELPTKDGVSCIFPQGTRHDLEAEGTSSAGASSNPCTHPGLDQKTKEGCVHQERSPSSHSERRQMEREFAEERLRTVMNAPHNQELLRKLGVANMMRESMNDDGQPRGTWRKQVGAIIAALGLKRKSVQRGPRGDRERIYSLDLKRYERIHRLSKPSYSRIAEEIRQLEADRSLLVDTGTG